MPKIGSADTWRHQWSGGPDSPREAPYRAASHRISSPRLGLVTAAAMALPVDIAGALSLWAESSRTSQDQSVPQRAAAIMTLQSHALRAQQLAVPTPVARNNSPASRALAIQEHGLFARLVEDSEPLTSHSRDDGTMLNLFFVRQLSTALEDPPTLTAKGRLLWGVLDTRYLLFERRCTHASSGH